MGQTRTHIAHYFCLQIFVLLLSLGNVSAGTSASDCYVTSRSYNGTTSVTKSGKTCQAWASQTPHTHTMTDAMFPVDESAQDASNYCRDPDFEGLPWCYTTDPDSKWEFCDIQLCPGLVSVNTDSVQYTVYTGESALLKCSVTGLKDSQQVKWEFVDHTMTVSLGNKTLTQPDKYLLAIPPQDQTGRTNWHLQVTNIQLHDQGTYKCSIVGAERPSSVVHHISIADAPTAAAPTENINVTGCCLDAGVATCALPLCTPQDHSIMELLPIINDEDCIYANLIKVLQCGRGERNHIGCCLRNGMSDMCLPLCDGTFTEAMLNEHQLDSCVALGSFQVIRCISEGQFSIPTRPVSVTGVSIGDGFLLAWKPPQKNPTSVMGYKIQYRTKGSVSGEFTTSSLQSATSYRKHGLVIGVVYEVQVMAVSAYGASEPSYTVDIYTFARMEPTAMNETIKACCVDHRVSPECLPYCNVDSTATGLHPDSVLPCYPELSNIFACLVGMRNHTPCCERMAIPPACYPLCAGKLPVHDWTITQCIAIMPQIMACAMEGSSMLPSPPQNTRLVPGSLTSDSLILQWDPPSDNSAISYVVAWKPDSLMAAFYETVNTEEESGTRHVVTGLQPLTQYEVFVASQNANGTSLPEVFIIVITEAKSSGWEPVPYNETECCVRNGVKDNCLPMCNHTFQLSDDILPLALLDCSAAVLPMFQCSSDILPKSPIDVYIQKIDFTSITLDWSKPDGPNVTSYVVKYSKDAYNWLQNSTVNTFIVLDQLASNQQYFLKVYSVNDNGTSLPSAQLMAFTLRVPVSGGGDQTTNWDQVWSNRSDCCSWMGLSTPCVDMCLAAAFDVTVANEDCLPDMDKILGCAVDGRNHYDCCKRTPGFPESCLRYCQGLVHTRDLNSALCLSHIGSMFTCFTEGQGLLPTAPQNVRVTNVTYEIISVQWDVPANNCDSCQYKLRLWITHSRIERIINESNLQHTFSGLDPSTRYTVSVLAMNQHGMSLPSPSIDVMTTLHPNYEIMVTNDPSGILDKGDQTTLQCLIIGSETIARFSWIHNKRTMSYDSRYVIKNLDENSAGTYTCLVQYYDDVTTSKSLVVSVRYIPVAVHIDHGNDTILPGLGMDAYIRCDYKGFPSIISWSKDGQALVGDNKYFVHPLVTQLDTGLTISTLQIHSVVDDDYGVYTCIGQNKLGKDKGISDTLRNVTPTLPPLPSVTPDLDTAGCCKARGLPQSCITNICTFDIDIATIIYDSSLAHCADHLPEYIACAADSRDHSQCCRKNGVIEYCLPFCSGSTPAYTDTWELVKCLSHEATIFNCLENGLENIPSPPQSVVVKMKADTIFVKWNSPEKNAHKVQNYKIYYNNTQMVHYAQVSDTMMSYSIPNVEKGTTYSIWVIAHNHHGSSNMSNQAFITVTAITPSKPLSLVYHVDGLNIELSWNSPMSKVPVTMYQIYYRTTTPLGEFHMANTTGVSYRLADLPPSTEYSISVTPHSVDGPGEQSDKIKVTTGIAPTEEPTLPPCNRLITAARSTPIPPAQYTGRDKNAVGLAVGLVLGIVVLVAIGIFALFIYRRKRGSKVPFNRPVAFENPQYADSSKVTGLPGDTEEDNQYNYTTLHEDHDNHSYSSIHGNGNQATGGASNSDENKTAGIDDPATLNLDT